MKNKSSNTTVKFDENMVFFAFKASEKHDIMCAAMANAMYSNIFDVVHSTIRGYIKYDETLDDKTIKMLEEIRSSLLDGLEGLDI